MKNFTVESVYISAKNKRFHCGKVYTTWQRTADFTVERYIHPGKEQKISLRKGIYNLAKNKRFHCGKVYTSRQRTKISLWKGIYIPAKNKRFHCGKV